MLTSAFGFLTLMLRMMYKSKCKDIKCGCIRITRDTETEKEEMEMTTRHNPPQSPRESVGGESKMTDFV